MLRLEDGTKYTRSRQNTIQNDSDDDTVIERDHIGDFGYTSRGSAYSKSSTDDI